MLVNIKSSTAYDSADEFLTCWGLPPVNIQDDFQYDEGEVIKNVLRNTDGHFIMQAMEIGYVVMELETNPWTFDQKTLMLSQLCKSS